MPAQSAKNYPLSVVSSTALESDGNSEVAGQGSPAHDLAPCSFCYGTGMEVIAGKGARRCRCRTEEQRKRLLEAARIPPRYTRCALSNYHPAPGNSTQLQAFNYAFKLVADKEYGWRIPGEAKEVVQKMLRVFNSSLLPAVFDDMRLQTVLRTDTAQVFSRSSVKADTVQALLAAVFVAEGMKGCQRIWEKWVRPHTSHALEHPLALDAVTELQEVTQGAYKVLPEYRCDKDPRSPDHKQRFLARCYINGKLCGSGVGDSKKEAKHAAARQALLKERKS